MSCNILQIPGYSMYTHKFHWNESDGSRQVRKCQFGELMKSTGVHMRGMNLFPLTTGTTWMMPGRMFLQSRRGVHTIPSWRLHQPANWGSWRDPSSSVFRTDRLPLCLARLLRNLESYVYVRCVGDNLEYFNLCGKVAAHLCKMTGIVYYFAGIFQYKSIDNAIIISIHLVIFFCVVYLPRNWEASVSVQLSTSGEWDDQLIVAQLLDMIFTMLRNSRSDPSLCLEEQEVRHIFEMCLRSWKEQSIFDADGISCINWMRPRLAYLECLGSNLVSTKYTHDHCVNAHSFNRNMIFKWCSFKN